MIPLSSIRKLGQGDFPYSAKPLPLEYIAVTYTEHGVERTVLLAPFAGSVIANDRQRERGAMAIALQEAIRTRTGQTLPGGASVADAGASFRRQKCSCYRLQRWRGAIMFFTAILKLVNEQRLPNADEFWFGPAFAVISTLMTFIALWERRRRAIAAGNLDALIRQ